MNSTMTPTSEAESPSVDRIALDATCVRLVQAADDRQPVAPERLLIVPWGDVRSASGDFTVDDESAAVTIAAFRQHGTDLPLDYEHQTLGGSYASPNGQAPAAGWITGLHAIAPDDAERQALALSAEVVANNESDATELQHALRPGIWADVTWTEEGRRHVVARQYRYLSPVALVRRTDRRLVGLHSVALTNKPAIVGMTPVVNRLAPETERSDDMIAAKTSTNTPSEGAKRDDEYRPGHTEIIAGLDYRDGAFDLTPLRNVLHLDESADVQTVVTAAVGRLRTLEHAERLREATARVEAASREGKLTAPQRDWAIALAMKDPAEFDQWADKAPLVVPLGRIVPHTDRQAIASAAIESAARAEWRANRDDLERLCSEDAYAAAAVRDAT